MRKRTILVLVMVCGMSILRGQVTTAPKQGLGENDQRVHALINARQTRLWDKYQEKYRRK